MAERFSRLYQIDTDLYLDGSPIVISAGVLLHDTVTGSIMVQLKFQNISRKNVTVAKIKLCAYDVTGKALQDLDEYQYLDIDVLPGAYWGGDKAIILPEKTTRAFTIKSAEIVFSDGTTWQTESVADFSSIPLSPSLEDELSNAVLADQYRLETNQEAKFVPKQYGTLWRCACGCINKGETCTSCRIEKEHVFGAFDISALSAKTADRLADEARQAKENQTQKKKRQKKTIFALTVGVILIVGFAFFMLWVKPNVIEPALKYNNAITLCQDGKYREAERLFAELGGYKDSDERLQNIPYWIAEDLYQEGELKAAIAAFIELGDYRDSANRAAQIAYQYAEMLQAEGEYISARKWFETAMPYEDSAECVEYLHGLIFEQGVDLFDDGKYSEALVYLKEVPSTYQTEYTSVAALIEQAETATEYLTILQALEEAGEMVQTSKDVDTLICAIQRYTEICESGEQITGIALSEQKKYMVEMYYLYASYAGIYPGKYGFLGNVSAELMFFPLAIESGYFCLKVSGSINYLVAEYISNGSLTSEHYELLDKSTIIYKNDSTELEYSRISY